MRPHKSPNNLFTLENSVFFMLYIGWTNRKRLSCANVSKVLTSLYYKLLKNVFRLMPPGGDRTGNPLLFNLALLAAFRPKKVKSAAPSGDSNRQTFSWHSGTLATELSQLLLVTRAQKPRVTIAAKLKLRSPSAADFGREPTLLALEAIGKGRDGPVVKGLTQAATGERSWVRASPTSC